MSSLQFDRAATFYDDTRGIPEDISERITQTILDLVPPDRPMLEAGAGTGRISVPLLRRGAPLVGVDLSSEMMRRLREKSVHAPLAQADISRLPFPNATFGLILTVHVLHLVGPWRDALREFRRVLRTGGVYLNSHNYRYSDSPNRRLRNQWHTLVEARGHTWRRPGAQDDEEVLAEVRKMGVQVEQIVVSQWTGSDTPQKEIDAIAARVTSDTWSVPDTVLAETVAGLRAWAATQYPDLNAPITLERRFIFDVIHF